MRSASEPLPLSLHVRRLRRTQGWPQAELARRAKVGRRALIELEAGKPTLRMDVVNRVLAVFGLRLGVQGPRQETPAQEAPPHEIRPHQAASQEAVPHNVVDGRGRVQRQAQYQVPPRVPRHVSAPEKPPDKTPAKPYVKAYEHKEDDWID